MPPIVDQIKRIADSETGLTGFYRKVCQVIAESTEAQAVVIWDCTAPPFRTISQLNRQTNQPIKVAVSQTQHLDLLAQATRSAEATLAELEDASEPTATATAEHSVIAFCPIPRGEHHDLVEVFLPPGWESSIYEKAKKDLRACCDAVAETLAANTFCEQPLSHPPRLAPNRQAGVDQKSLQKLDHFASNIHASIDLKETAVHIANESQSILGCDRVSVVRFDRKCKTLAISGLPKFNRRSNAISFLEDLATATLKTGQPFWYPDDQSEQLPQIAEPLDRYLTEGVTRSLVIMPLFETTEATRLSPEEIQYAPANTVIGGVIFENFSGQWQRKAMAQPVSTVTRHAATAYRNAYDHQNLFLYSLWRTLGKVKKLTRPRYFSKTMMVLGIIFALIASMFFVPARLKVSGDGELVPAVRRNVFAQVDGQVVEVLAQHGQQVEKDQLLARMASSELKIQLNDIQNKIELTNKQIDALDKRRLGNVNRDQTPAEIAQEDLERTTLLQQLESFQHEREIYKRELEHLTIKSPIAGQVVSDNLQQMLTDRPIVAGHIIMQVAKTDGEWIIEMDLPDRRIGHLLRAQKEQGTRLKATFILTADPGRKLSGTVFDVARATSVTRNKGQTIRVKIRLDDPGQVDIRQVGTSAVVKIDCGKCSLGYSVFHDISEFVQSNVLFHFQ